MEKKPNTTKRITLLFFFIFFLIISLIGLLIYALFNESTPQLFPLNDSHASYIILKRYDRYWINYTSPNHQIEVFVANSDEELEPFVDKKVRLTGNFITTNKQCIASKCDEGRNFFVGVNIATIQHAPN